MRTGRIARLVRAGLSTGVSDGVFASVLSVAFFHSTVGRLWRGVASVVLGPSAMQGGARTALIGVFLHFCTAFFWSAVFLVLVETSAGLRRVLRSPFGVLKAAAVYAPLEWMAMSLLIIPLFTRHAPAINARWWVQFFGQIVFVGLPIAGLIGAGAGDATQPTRG